MMVGRVVRLDEGPAHIMAASDVGNTLTAPVQSLERLCVKYWEIIADKIAASGWTWGYCRAATRYGWRYIVDAHCGDGRRFIVESDELLSAFVELEATLL